MAARQFRIRGVVQGVGYRYEMCREARRLALTGWVRNRRDGSVEAVAVGPVTQLDALQRWAARGPASARVDAVDTHDLSDEAASALGARRDDFTQVESA